LSCEVTVLLFHSLRELAGAKEVKVTPELCTVAGLIEHFLMERPGSREELMNADGEISSRYTIVVNQQVTPRELWKETTLSNGDEVAFLTMITGG
jgi:thiamine biosynthesis protein ThiS